MAKNKFGLDFDGFLDLAREVDNLGVDALKTATENALTKSKEYIDAEIVAAMNSSPYSFTAGKKHSKGRARASAEEVAKIPVEWDGTVAKAYIGVDLKKAPETIILANGTPHIKADTKLKNALKVKGKVQKEVSRIQQEEFQKVISEAMKNG